ncbi:DUF2442 domain-containing protein [Candidatus Acetothermia bacterium]|nr:DUF2442 domain-containing protein [Candidatus Acetothermia bacterium]MBI3460897.1 DUF2442 domain-containing protein [Candidatus Acetothermia bacterium]MBI3659501.1 DUF2442 domain-containing protein [Candidatus Acetothermia bacterium]
MTWNSYSRTDGRIISVPLAWSWRLSEATPAQRAHFEIIGDGQGVHWPDVDEDISAKGMLRGVPARRPHRARAGGAVRRSVDDQWEWSASLYNY